MQSSVVFFLVSFLSACAFALPTASSAEGAAAGRTSRFAARDAGRLDTRAPQQGNGQAGAGQGAGNTPTANRNGVSDAQVMNAVMSWMQDTGKVTKFLNSATSYTGAEFTKQATIALNAEVDELNHKMVLDAALTGTDMVAQANNVLATQGTFQQVVDTLQSMVTNGPDTAQKDVNAINNNRCVNVLPNIDMYFAAAGMPQVQSVRPTGCLEVEGANVTPAVPPPANNGGGAAAAPPPPPPPQVTPPPAASPASPATANNQNPNRNQGSNSNNQSQGSSSNNQNQSSGNVDPNLQSQNQNQGSGNNQNQGNGNNQNQSPAQNQASNNGQAQNSGNRNNGNGNGSGLQPASLGTNGKNGGNTNTNANNGQRPQQQQQSTKPGGSRLQPAQLGSPKPANN